MDNTADMAQGQSKHTPLPLVFLRVLLACTPDELGRINAAIRAAHHLPSGADRVIAAGIADPAIAAKLEQLEAKRIKARKAGTVYAQGMNREQIRATAQQKREAEEARRQERERQRQQREAQLEAEKRERAEARKLAQQQRRKRKPQPEAAAIRATPQQITAEPPPPPVAPQTGEPQQTAPAKRKRKQWRGQMRKIRKFKRRH